MNDAAAEKISALKNIILARADGQRSAILSDARKEAQTWVQKETEKLTRETSLVEQDAKTRADEIHRRQVLAAERERSVETLRLQNRLLTTLIGRFQDGLIKLRENPDYAQILGGLLVKGAKQLGSDQVQLQLGALDTPLLEQILASARQKNSNLTVTVISAPAPILGGCWILSQDGKRQVNMDWQSQTQEISDKLAERLLAVL